MRYLLDISLWHNLIQVSFEFNYLYFVTCDSLYEISQFSPSHRNFSSHLSLYFFRPRRSVMDWCGRTPTRCSIIHRHARGNATLLYQVCPLSALSRQPFRRDIVFRCIERPREPRRLSNRSVRSLSRFRPNLRAIIPEKVSDNGKINSKTVAELKKESTQGFALSL